jgi:hypothetical protein
MDIVRADGALHLAGGRIVAFAAPGLTVLFIMPPRSPPLYLLEFVRGAQLFVGPHYSNESDLYSSTALQ